MNTKTSLSRIQVDELLGIYKDPNDRFLLESEILFPTLESKLWFGEESSYSYKGMNVVSGRELEEVCKQAGYLLYRDAILKNTEGFPQLDAAQIYHLDKLLEVVRVSPAYRIFMPRTKAKDKIIATHKDVRADKNYYFSYNVQIPKMFDADVVAQIIFDRSDKYIDAKAWPPF